MASSYRERSIVVEEPGRAIPRVGTSRRYAWLAVGVAITDALSVEVAVLITRLQLGASGMRARSFVLLALAPLVWVGVFYALHLYSLPRLSPATEFRRVIEASAFAVALSVVIDAPPGRGSLAASSRGWVGLVWGLALVLTLLMRQLWHKLMGRMRDCGELAYRTVIVGANEEATRLAQKFRAHPSLGFLPVGLLRTGEDWPESDSDPVLGDIDDLAGLVTDTGVECVFIASSAVVPDQISRIFRTLRPHDVEIRISANLADILATRLMVQPIGDLLALSLRPVRLSGRQAMTKSAFDLVAGAIVIVVSAPVWLLSAALVAVTSRGPVLYRQERLGRRGRPFTMYKFRTMIRGAEALRSVLDSRNEASAPLFKVRDDPRITPVGRWLRRLSIDELPQLINVIRGEMSLVGPRPPLASEVARYEDWHRDRLDVRPGITGLWQVGGRSELSFDDYVRMDLFYIENWSITYDVFILAKTIPAVLSSRGAF